MPVKNDQELKRKITDRWKIIRFCAVGHLDVEVVKAFAQLEYILEKAGLLAQTRERRKNRKKLMNPDLSPRL
jgi:hypothetical protein